MIFTNKRTVISLISILVEIAIIAALVVVLDVHYTTQQWLWFAIGVVTGRVILDLSKRFIR